MSVLRSFLGPTLFLAALTASPALRAQDLTVTNLDWISPDDAPDTLPEIKALARARLAVPAKIKPATDPAYLEVHLSLSDDGKVARQWSIASTPLLDEIDWKALSASHAKPAQRAGKPVWAEVRYQVIFNPNSAAEDTPNATPRLLSVTLPLLPTTEKTKTERRIVVPVRVTVDSTGNVTATAVDADIDLDTSLVEAARKAARRSRFDPARRDGQPITADVMLPILFTPDEEISNFADLTTPPKPLSRTAPVYPYPMRRAGYEGSVIIGFVVGTEGRVRDTYVVQSSDPSFDEAAVEAISQWRFKPGMVNGRAVNTRMQVPIQFSIEGSGVSRWQIKRPKKFPDDASEAMQWDEPPSMAGYAPPIYPRDALLDGREGKVMVAFVIGPSGRVIRVQPVGEGDADFQAAAVAAAESFKFLPAAKEGKPCYAALRMEFDFRMNGRGEAAVTSELRRVVKQFKKSPEDFWPLQDLDEVPKPIARKAPVVPWEARGDHSNGEAVIEFIIDEKGFARLPRIVEATRPDFGYAAVQAVATWRFEAPRRNGKPVNAVVRIPIKFSVE